MNILEKLIYRLKKINIEIELIGNYPWVYLHKVNGNKVTDKFMANHGFTIAFLPTKINDDTITLTDISEIFKIIRKYK